MTTNPSELASRIHTAAQTQADAVLAALQAKPRAYMVGIAGIPGSGKTTLCRELLRRRPEAVVLPMDGYHLPRSRLDAEGLRFRGAPHTFAADDFRADMESLRRNRAGVFPEFDHAEKDPRPGAIRVTPSVPLVIVEGIYVLMQSWRVEPLLDLKIFIDCDLDEAVERLAARHVACGLETTLEEGRRRAIENDRRNSLTILADGCRERADLRLRASNATV
jgi:pantothenate kinase